MSDKNTQDTIILSFLTFMVGTLVGAVAALLFAPMSGRELQGRIKEEAEAGWTKTTAEWNQSMADMQKMIEDIRDQVNTYQRRALDDVKAQVEQLQTRLDNAEAEGSVDQSVVEE